MSPSCNTCPFGERVAKIEAIVDRLDRELLGNGQPGAIQVLFAKIERVNSDIEYMKRFKWQIVGGVTVAASVITFMMEVIINRMLKG